MTSLTDVNAMSAAEFVDCFGDVAEHSPWVAEKAFGSAPFADRDAVIAAFENAMMAAGETERLRLVRAHPDLAGKAAIAGDLADESRKEQAGAGLDTLSPEEFSRFTDLNDRYRKKFGFPFIFAVRGSTRHMILDAFEDRIGNSRETEFSIALQQVARIFRFRLEDRIANGT